MRIAVWHNLPSGGGKRALYYHVKGLVERGHHVESWCPPTADQSYLPLSELITEHVVPLEWPERPARRGWLAPIRDMDAKLEAMRTHCEACAREIDRAQFDILFANSCMYFRTTPIGHLVHIPSALYLQEPYRPLYEAMPTLPWLAIREPTEVWWSPRYLRWFLRDLARVQPLRVQIRDELLNAKGFDRLLVNSLYSRESVLRAYGIDATVCYLGVDTDLFHDTGQPRGGFVLSVGALVPEKNAPFVVRAVGSMPEPRPALVWVANICDDRYVAQVRELADDMHVDFHPVIRITDEELVSLYGRAAAMVYAPRLEPFGLVPLEANACGLPVVATAEGGVRETVLHGVNGLLADHDPQALGEAIARIVTDPGYARELGTNGRSLVEDRWSLASAIDRLEKQLIAVADQRSVDAMGGTDD